MDVKDLLAAVGVAVEDYAVATLGNSMFLSEVLCGGKHASDKVLVFIVDIIRCWDMSFWNYKDVNRRLLVDVIDGDKFIVVD